MEIVKVNIIQDFTGKHPDALVPSKDWIAKAKGALWVSISDVRNTFGSASYVKGFVIFNIGGNNYRLLTEIDFTKQVISIIRMGTHAEYDRWKL